MEKKRPQLNHDELLQLRWLLGGVAALTGAWAVAFLEVDAAGLLGFCTLAIALVLWRPSLPAKVPALVHRLAFPAIVAFAVFDFYSQGEVLPVMTRMALLLLTYRAISYRKRRDELQLVVLGLFLVVVAGVLTVSMIFAVQIIAFTGLALAMLMAMTLSEATGVKTSDTGRIPGWAEHVEWGKVFAKVRAVSDWRLLVLGGLLFVGVAVVSGLLFLAIPRFDLGNSLFLEGLIKRKSRSGFTDTLQFTDVTDLLKDETVAMRVEVPDRSALPAQLYWRMVVMDEYRDNAFRVSAALKAAAFDRATTVQRLRGLEGGARGETPWTFYVEAGTGRYVPLTGGFRWLNFTEPQNLRASSSLRVIELTREPLSMKAYRVQGMADGDRLADPEFASRMRRPVEERRAASLSRPEFLEVNLADADRARLDRVVQEITGGVDMPAQDFARKAQAWIGARHAYSLNMELPAGDGDRLVRWLVSEEPGHCELFAGAFALLARAAGHPTRIVGGFAGGTWNEDYLIVRNSDAHAWCEIFDGRAGWLRVDPTRGAGGGENRSAVDALTDGAMIRDEAGGWAATMDRLRLFWYRRIVNFDQGDQRVLTSSLKKTAQDLGNGIKTWTERVIADLRAWLAKPWSGGRIGKVVGAALIAAALWWSWRRKGRAWWLSWRSARGRGLDPVRGEAARWLKKLPLTDETESPKEETLRAVRRDLERVRYGARETWPPTAALWQQARRLSRERGRVRRVRP